jgi:DNA-binding transcriptional LysR family regulator
LTPNHDRATESRNPRDREVFAGLQLDNHRLVTFGEFVPSHLADMNWLETAAMPDGTKRLATLQINNILSIKRAVQQGAGIAMLPDYVVEKQSGLVQVMPDLEVPSFDTYFCYPTSMKNQARLNAFRDFLLSKARGWSF